ncbi:DJ-1/PfpI family protein [Chloroflexota bacterium]
MNRIVLTTLLVAAIVLIAGCSPSQSPPSQSPPPQPTAEQIAAAQPEATKPPTTAPTKTKAAPTDAPPTATSPLENTPTPLRPTLEPTSTQWEPQIPEGQCQPSETRTCSILYIFVDKYDDEHVLKTYPAFERAGYQHYVASNTLEEIRGFHECYDFTPAQPDMLLEDVSVGEYDAIFFPGSDHNNVILHNDKEAHRIAADAMSSGKVLVAVSDSPVILAKAGLLEGRTVNVIYNVYMHGVADQWRNAIERNGAIYTDRSPVRDGLLITADTATIKLVRAIIEVLEELIP